MNAYIVAQEILNHYNRNRQVGHTTTVIHGVLKTPSKLVVHSEEMKKTINAEAGESISTITLTEIERGYLNGTNSPIAFDNYALQQILGELVGTVAALRKENERLNNTVNLVKIILS